MTLPYLFAQDLSAQVPDMRKWLLENEQLENERLENGQLKNRQLKDASLTSTQTQRLALPLESVLQLSIYDSLTLGTVSKQHLRADAWWILGSVGCHLCNDVLGILRLFYHVHLIKIDYLDIADLPEDVMWQFADKIPVLMTPTAMLTYPFSLADLHQLL